MNTNNTLQRVALFFGAFLLAFSLKAQLEFCDITANHPFFYNAPYYWDADYVSHDLCEVETDLKIAVANPCGGAVLSVRYLLFLDMDRDGSQETVIDSDNPPGYNNLYYNNVNTPNYSGGTPWAFDFRNVDANNKWGFGVWINALAAGQYEAHVRWINQVTVPASGVVPELPYGTHKITWWIEDACGGTTVSTQEFIVKDCRPPTVLCEDVTAANLMFSPAGGNTILWASDFLQYLEDNATPSPLVKIAIRRSGHPDGQGATTGFPRDILGAPQTQVSFTCADLDSVNLVEIWSMDIAGNTDFCTSTALIQDNFGACQSQAIILVSVLNELGVGVLGVGAGAAGGNAFPGVNMDGITDSAGQAIFAVPFSSNVTISPSKVTGTLNGVNVWDMILLRRHIQNLAPLPSPYRLIAADINKSGQITDYDLSELRKMLLGVYPEWPDNASWRFIASNQQFSDPTDPFLEVLRENIQLSNIQADSSYTDFIGVKIGDLDLNANPSAFRPASDRASDTLFFEVKASPAVTYPLSPFPTGNTGDRWVKTGEVFSVQMTPLGEVEGYQFTLECPYLEVLDVVNQNMDEANFALFGPPPGVSEGSAMTTVFDHPDPLAHQPIAFTIKLRAKTDAYLSDLLAVSSRITQAQAFETAIPMPVALRFGPRDEGFQLYANTPNPFTQKTQIAFSLPMAADAKISVFDANGRVLYTVADYFPQGNQSVTLDRSMLGQAQGVIVYRIEAGPYSGYGKMILHR